MKRISAIVFCGLFFIQHALCAEYNITNYGAKGDGTTLNTKAIQSAINKCRQDGGGIVIVPTGVFISGTLHLYSNINLHLQSGAVLKGSKNLADYAPAETVHFGLLYTEDATNITISGEGNIDGNGDNFFIPGKAKKIDAEGTQYTRQKEHFREVHDGIGDGPIVPKDRPYQMIIFSNCKLVTVKDVLISNSPFWTMHFADCDAVNVSGIRLFTNLLAPNADGIDITSCTNVTVANCDIRSGDDAIAITGYDHHFEIPGFKHLRHLSENINISNCNLQSYSSGIRIGFLDQNTVRNIHVSNVNITNSTRGIGIFLRDEGSLENITFSDMYIETKLRTGDWWGNGEPIHISAVRGKENVQLGKIKHVLFNHIICKAENGILLYGTAESTLEDISFNDVRYELTDSKLNDIAGGNIDLRGCLRDKEKLFAREIPGLLAQYINGLSITRFTMEWTNTRMPFFTHGIELDHFSNVSIISFTGTASPVNNKAFRIYAEDGKQFFTDDKNNIMLKNVD